ncbi:endopolygalacturonase [Nitzschia inconspicua]|uniref:Endopolygalacturonase n=1 Tax=Nitzschia inconspicua TaxID=303405 RepID=A0A9K3M954_9STRA|nr:endopolygalacturonase [Nitzschia inconspicua]
MMRFTTLFQTILLVCTARSSFSGTLSCCRNAKDSIQIRTIDVKQHGVVGDGQHDDTATMRRVLQSLDGALHDDMSSCCCHKLHVIIPKDVVVLSYPLNITSCTILQIDGVLLAMPSTEHWPILPPVNIYGNSEDTYHGARIINQYHPFVYAAHASHIRITGQGTIHGNGHFWWQMFQNASVPLQLGGRPNLIQTLDCNDVEIDSITLVDSAFWTVHPMLSRNVHIHHVIIRAPMYAPNVDGIDPDSCHNVMIEHNDVACGDDHIAIKAGLCGLSNDRNSINNCMDKEWEHSRSVPTRNVTVRHNVFRTGMGVAVGSESSGGIQDVHVYNNTIGVCQSGHDDPQKSCGWGPALHLKTTITRSGSIQNVYFENNTVYNNSMFILVETNYHGENRPQIPDRYPKTLVKGIYFRNNRAIGTATAAIFRCDALDPCHEIHVVNNYIANSRNDDPWGCEYIQSYHVENNVPEGLDDCMAASMNGTASNVVTKVNSSKKLWLQHPPLQKEERMAAIAHK